MNDFETEVRAIGNRLYARAEGRPALYRGFIGRLLTTAMVTPRLRDGLFQLVDVLPEVRHAPDVAAHLRAYLADMDNSDPWQRSLRWLMGRPAMAWSVRLIVRHLARHFLVLETEQGLARLLRMLQRVPAQASFDAVGETVLSEREADNYLARNLQLLRWLAPGGRPHLSLKLTALTARFDPLDAKGSRARIWQRLAPLLAEAARHEATVTVDMEQRELKPLILDLFIDMANDFPGRWQPAVALQAYLPETADDLARILGVAERLGRRLGVRLVKGAYWDQEVAWAAQRGWPVPVLRDKAATDAHYERHTGWLLEHSEALHPAIATHNLRSLAVALAHARRLDLAMDGSRWEVQMLRGMAEPLRDAIAAIGAPLRIYVPVGELETGIAYLIRRLLENTASTSVLRQSYVGGVDAEALLAVPVPSALPATALSSTVAITPVQGNLPVLDLSRAEVRAEFSAALRAVRARLPRQYAGGPSGGPQRYLVRNPAQPSEVLGEVDLADADQADDAVRRSRAAFPSWAAMPLAERCRVLRVAASLIEKRRIDLAALEVLEQAKPWREADADVAEAVDFLRYYADAMAKLDGWHTTVDFPGERNRYRYAPRGIAVVIAPWNFPLAILAGMTSAALVTGNTTIMKPALPALLVAHEFFEILLAAGIPPGAVQWLPGGAELGAALVSHADVQVIAFTGSQAVGLRILEAAHRRTPAQRHVKQVVCEMGGKNAIVVDSDADLDEAVTGILASAFGYSGQKCSACSRVIAVEAIHDRLLARLTEAATALAWGPPEDPAYDHGPLITKAARDKAVAYLDIGKSEGQLAWLGAVPDDGGWYAPPAIFAGIRPEHRLARDEIFGPVLAVMRARDFVTALALANDSDYGLTGGVYSRLPPHLQLATDTLRIGNLYLNRKTTGARVGIQPFGGVGLSGTGVQAGGPDYLKQFLWSRCVSSNEQRHGLILE
jgi:RHH-type transcriptional regulator, proline utilization regulon repressor / proline dehydrogenase / delta 1-pyrroline-5-carboxylate dehydrogenase